MPASAGRVRMPHNNRVSVSASLNTTGIWAKTIGHNPYAGKSDEADAVPEVSKEDAEVQKQLREAARQQNVADGINRDDFAQKMYRGLKGGKKRRGMVDEVAEAAAKERENMIKVLEAVDSSSEDEDEYEKLQSTKAEKKKKKKKEKKRKKEKRKSKRKRKYSSDESDSDSDDDSKSDYSTDSSSYERRRKKRRKDKKRSSKHKKKDRRKRDDGSSDDSDDDSRPKSKEKKRSRSESGKKKEEKDASERKDPFLAAETFDGSKKGYAYRDGDKGMGYYIDNAPKVDQGRLKEQLKRFSD